MSAESVLLINSPRELSPLLPRSSDKRMPLGLLYISAFLKAGGTRCKVVDAEALGMGLVDIMRVVCREDPFLVGLNCHTLNRLTVYEIVRAIRLLRPDCLLVLGGAHPGLAPESTFRECPEIDAIVAGEGEIACSEIVLHPRDLDKVRGLFLMRGGRLISTGRAARIGNLDELPFPDLEDVPLGDYLRYEDSDLPGLWRRGYLVASRGCMYRCSYCTEWSFWGASTTFRSPENVIKEIEGYCQGSGLERFYFYDDTFTDWPGIDKFCEMAVQTGISWSCSTRIDHLSASVVGMLAKGGCREIAVGLESGSSRSLQAMQKGWESRMTGLQVGDALQMCSDSGITPRAHFMIGFPWESREDIAATVSFAVSLKRHSLQDANFFSVKAYPGTSFYKQVVRDTAGSGNVTNWADAWSVYDWDSTKNLQVAAKLRRFNDISRPSLHPHLSSLAVRSLTRNAWEIFFSDAELDTVDDLLWRGVAWEE